MIQRLILVFNLIFGSTALADSKKTSYGFSAQVGLGEMGNTTSVLPRKMNYVPISTFVARNYKKIRYGIEAEYQYVTQIDDPSNFMNFNLSGSALSVGIKLDYYDGKNSFGLVYRPYHVYTLSQKTYLGSESQYKSDQGISIQYSRALNKRFGFIMSYTTDTFKQSYDSDPIKWNRISAGLLISNY